jgi:hypothetical protein
VTTEVEALRDILDWGLYYVGNELECVCQSNERDLDGVRRTLDEARFLVDTLYQLREPVAV